MTNRALTRLFGWLRDHAEINNNILRQIFDPNDMRQVIHNWDEVARPGGRDAIGHESPGAAR
jgi:hypothetical protein